MLFEKYNLSWEIKLENILLGTLLLWIVQFLQLLWCLKDYRNFEETCTYTEGRLRMLLCYISGIFLINTYPILLALCGDYSTATITLSVLVVLTAPVPIILLIITLIPTKIF
jgi:hypothetical protein